MVLGVGIFAFISIHYVLATAFFYRLNDSFVLPVLIAMVYSLAILIAVREMASNHCEYGFLAGLGTRLLYIVLSIFLGVLLAQPVVFKVVEQGISEQISHDVDQKNMTNLSCHNSPGHIIF